MGGMKPEHPRPTWGSPRAFVEWAAFLALLSLGIAFHSSLINLGLMALYAAVMLFGSCALLWRVLKRKPGDPPVGMGQTAGLPRRLRRWMLGESDRRNS